VPNIWWKEDGTSFGTIGGGRVEAEVWQEQTGDGERGRECLHLPADRRQLAEGGLIWWGEIDIFLEPLDQELLDILSGSFEIKQKGGSASCDLNLPGSSFCEGPRTQGLAETFRRESGSPDHSEALERRVF